MLDAIMTLIDVSTKSVTEIYDNKVDDKDTKPLFIHSIDTKEVILFHCLSLAFKNGTWLSWQSNRAVCEGFLVQIPVNPTREMCLPSPVGGSVGI